jgi:hypothetical protein
LISDVEAWKEMQEHAWEVGMSAKKQHASHKSHKEVSTTQGDGEGRSEERQVQDSSISSSEGKEKDLGSLEARHEEMVKELEEMGKKYGSLFALADQEGLKS